VNAVFERDYVRTSVSPRYLLLRGGFALAVGTIVLLLVLGASLTGDYSDVGVRVLKVALYSGLALVLLAVPGTFATSLVHARAQNSLAILFASPLTPLQVAWGAFAARAAGYAVFVFACWPPVTIALSYGGIRPGQLVLATAALLGSLLIAAAPSFVNSAFARSTGPAVVGSYLAVGTLLAAAAAAGEMVAATSPLAATSVSPLHALAWAVDPARAAGPGREGAWVLLLLGVTAAAASIGISAWRLHRESRGGTDAAVSAAAARGYRPLVHRNPVLDREVRTGGSLRARSAGRTLVGVLALSEAGYAFTVLRLGAADSVPVFAGFLTFQTVLLVLAAAAAGATSLAAEKESGTLDVLRVTPLRPVEIVEGKLLGLFRSMLPALAVPVLHLAWGAATGIVSPLAVPAWLVGGAIVSAAWVVIGMGQSLDQRDPHRAVVRTMGILVVLGFVLAGYEGALVAGVASDVDRWVRYPAAFGANPAAAILCWVGGLRTGGSDAESTALAPPGSEDAGFAFVAGVVWLSLHLAAGTFVYRRLVHIYRTRFEG
jgi:ABC-type transport system involved in multi-copper enzyme maturation permease subunit